jgi:hypothetical protein
MNGQATNISLSLSGLLAIIIGEERNPFGRSS